MDVRVKAEQLLVACSLNDVEGKSIPMPANALHSIIF